MSKTRKTGHELGMLAEGGIFDEGLFLGPTFLFAFGKTYGKPIFKFKVMFFFLSHFIKHHSISECFYFYFLKVT